jgi:hypothetical protein
MKTSRRKSMCNGGVADESKAGLLAQKCFEIIIRDEGPLGLEFGVDANSGRIILVGLRKAGLIAQVAPGVLKYLDRLDGINGDVDGVGIRRR